VAAECGITRVLVPVEPGTLCARGILLSDVSLDLVRGEIIEATDTNWARIAGYFASMGDQGQDWLDGERIAPERRRFERVIDARYKGQNHEVQVRLDGPPDRTGFLAGFAEAHRREYGYDIQDRAVEVVNCRLKAVGLIDRPQPRFIGGSGVIRPKARRMVHFDDAWTDTPIFDRADLAVGTHLSGPAIIDEMSATTIVPPSWSVTVDANGNLLLEATP
jgi:N-methylhydantoinase A